MRGFGRGSWRRSAARFVRWVAGTSSSSGGGGDPVNSAPTQPTAITTITFYLGQVGTSSIAGYFNDVDGDSIGFTLVGSAPPGVTFASSGLFTYDGTGSAPVSTDGNYVIADDGHPAEVVANFFIWSSTAGTKSFTFGQPYAKGDVPSGNDIVANVSTFQTIVKNRWNDDSVKYAIHSGYVSIAANTTVTLALALGTAVSVAPLTETNLTSIAPAVTVGFGAYGNVVLGDLTGVSSTGAKGSSGRFRQWIEGPYCSEWHYYSQVGSDPHLNAWIYARLYRNNDLWLCVVPENGWFNVSAPGRRDYDLVIRAGDSTRLSVTPYTYFRNNPARLSDTQFVVSGIDVRSYISTGQRILAFNTSATVVGAVSAATYDGANTTVGVQWDSGVTPAPVSAIRMTGHLHHQRWGYEFWYGTDPGLHMYHDVSYLRSTKMVPNYGWHQPASAYYESLSQDNSAPFLQQNMPTNMGDGGFDPTIGLLPTHDAMYCATGKLQAFRSVIANSYAYGRYNIHYRDETTMKPVRPLSYGTYGINQTFSGISDLGSNTTVTPTPSGGMSPVWKKSHHPAAGYLAYLMTGNYFHMEEAQFIGGICALEQSTGSRRGSLFVMSNQNRDVAWGFRSMMQATLVTPDDDSTMRSEFTSILGNGVAYYNDRFLTSAEWANNLGIWMLYSANPIAGDSPNSGNGVWDEQSWQKDFAAAVLGWTSQMELPFTSAHSSAAISLRDISFQNTVMRLGTGGVSAYPYTHAGQNWHGYGEPETYPPTWYENGGQVFLGTFGSVAPTVTFGAKLSGGYADENISFAEGVFANFFAAAAYAVDCSASGASVGWTYLICASNYVSNTDWFNHRPVFGIVPRTYS
jgi:hypothetical protein